ncbi:MAG: hypothetical protein ACTHMS_01450 [Jatrophihabitans sp.]|uniref:hypothetical protein n=1 Tax=Jatrophihabitans sp. TaxID=1932789 RepID=UPI003F7DAD7E
MTDFLTQSQLGLLARTLHVEPDEIRSLEHLGAAALHELRERISNRLFDQHAAMFGRISKLAPLVPNAVVAKVSELAVPALVAGRAAGALGVDHPGRIEDLLSRLSAGYMADCAPHLDPRAIAVLAPRVSGDVLVPAAAELMRRKDYVTTASFVEFATPELIRAFERGIDDDLGLLHTAALTYSADILSDVIRAIPTARLDSIMRSSLTTPESIRAGLSVLSRLPAAQRAELGDALVAHVTPEVRPALLDAVVDGEMAGELLDLIAVVSDEARRVLADDPALATDARTAALEAAADTDARRQALEALRALLPA